MNRLPLFAILLLAVAAPFAVAEPYENFDTWCGGGTDGLTSTDANWESGSAPDVTAGDLLAVFATGGSEAELPGGTAAAFAGIVLDGANLGGNHFKFTAGSGATATIGACALTVSNAPSAITWKMGWPITIRDFPQTWTIGANNTVEFNERIDGEQDLVFAGSGTAKLNADSTRSGTLKVTSGTLCLDASCRTVSQLRSSGYIDTTNNLVAAHDAAHVHWGGEWRMPTAGEMDALVENCTATWTTTNGVSGYLVTGTGEYADRSIFLPAAGYGGSSNLTDLGSQGQYWSSSPLPGNTMGSYYLYLNSGGFGRGNYIRYNGQPVRPVRNAD